MACGSCNKNRQAYVIKNNVATKIQSKPVADVKAPVPNVVPLNGIKVVRSLATEQNNTRRCPVCKMILKRVSRAGQGDLMQCTNQQCGYLRKL